MTDLEKGVSRGAYLTLAFLALVYGAVSLARYIEAPALGFFMGAMIGAAYTLARLALERGTDAERSPGQDVQA